jgi:hypothetical protein
LRNTTNLGIFMRVLERLRSVVGLKHFRPCLFCFHLLSLLLQKVEEVKGLVVMEKSKLASMAQALQHKQGEVEKKRKLWLNVESRLATMQERRARGIAGRDDLQSQVVEVCIRRERRQQRCQSQIVEVCIRRERRQQRCQSQIVEVCIRRERRQHRRQEYRAEDLIL